jgi:hypothetical protein
MSESLVGFNTAATRQKVGRLLNASAGSCGGTNVPGATVCAIVIVVSGRESEERVSQVAAAEAGELGIVINMAAKIPPSSFMRSLFQVLRKPTPRRERSLPKEGLKVGSYVESPRLLSVAWIQFEVEILQPIAVSPLSNAGFRGRREDSAIVSIIDIIDADFRGLGRRAITRNHRREVVRPSMVRKWLEVGMNLIHRRFPVPGNLIDR